MSKNRREILAAIALACMAAHDPALGQDWPSRPIAIVVPFAPGGPTDVQARLIAEALSQRLGQQVLVDNRPGAGGNVGTALVARAAPDGYTLLAGTVGTHAVNEFLYPSLGFDPQKDFTPIGIIGSGPNVLVVNPRFEARTAVDLVALAKASPGKLNYASPGSGTSNHLAMELFKSRAGIDIQGVSYRGAGPALADVVAGHVPMMFNGLDNALPTIRGGQVRALAISARERSAALPDVPTLIELGYQDFETASWTCLFAPAAAPAALAERLNALVGELTASEKVAERHRELGITAPARSIADLRAFIAKERERWGEAVRISGAKVE